jgi:hypothetical protein
LFIVEAKIMESKVLLTVDLSYIRKMEQENIFSLELKKRDWVRLYNNTPIWKSRISPDFSDENVISKAKEDLTYAATAAGITRIGAEIYFSGGYSVVI